MLSVTVHRKQLIHDTCTMHIEEGKHALCGYMPKAAPA